MKWRKTHKLCKPIGHSWKVLGCIVFGCWLVGCKSPAGMTSSGAEIMKTEEVFFASLLEHAFQFDTFSARLNLEFSGIQQEFSSRVQMKMIRDDRMQFSIQPFLGIEMVRVEISKDSIKILDRINKYFVADSYQRLKNEMEIDFNFQNLQALFTNQLFVPGITTISIRHFRQFRVTKRNLLADFQFKDGSESRYTFTADGDERLLSTMVENGNYRLTWNYSHFQTVDNQVFPMNMTVHLSDVDQTQGTVSLTFSSPEINRPLSMDFNIPSGCKRVTLEQMIHTIGK